MSDDKDNNYKEITIYTTPTCGFCHMVKEYLSGKDIEYKTKDITTDENAYKEVLESTGQLGVPVVNIGSKTIIGFDRPKIDLALREAGLV